MLEVTNRCNLQCITCPREYNFGKEMDKGEMELALLKGIIDEVSPYIDSIGLTGLGEPLLYKNLVEAVQYIRNKKNGAVITISTNAYVPGIGKTIQEVKGYIDSIQVSVDGVRDRYESIRKGATYPEFIQHVRKIREITTDTGTGIMFNMVVMKENFKEMVKVVDLAHELEIDHVCFTLFNLAAATGYEASYYRFFASAEFQEELVKLKESAKTYPGIDIALWDQHTPPGFRKCPFPWNHFYITWDGFLVPCCAKPFPKELNFGNVFQSGVMNCLNSRAFRDFRKMWYANETPSFCRKCHMIDLPSL
jgi:radical SAM protein with 4Fe4S-binding SPASM domain